MASKLKIALCDRSFAHSLAIGSGDYPWPPRYFEWDRAACDAHDRPVVFTDLELGRVTESRSPYKIALLLESRAIAPKMYKNILRIEKSFDLILTYDQKLLSRGGKYQFYPFGGCWIAPGDSRIYPKEKNVSLIASAKRQTEGHKLRHRAVAMLKESVDVFGRGYRPVEHKLEALAPYRYSVVIENVRKPNYFTEKIVDCFATGTVPIYWGCPNIGEFFDPSGIILFKSWRELGGIIRAIGLADYEARLGAININLERVGTYRTPEDWLWPNVFSKLMPVLPHKRILPS